MKVLAKAKKNARFHLLFCVCDVWKPRHSSSDIAVYDAFVNAQAELNPALAALDTTWKALLSTSASRRNHPRQHYWTGIQSQHGANRHGGSDIGGIGIVPLLTGGGACTTDTTPPATLLFLTMASVCGAGQSGPRWNGDGGGHGFTLAEASAGNTSVIELFTSAPGIPIDPGVFSGNFTVSQTPEPSTLLLTVAAGAMLFASKRRAHRALKAT
jgi:hypothetical protein